MPTIWDLMPAALWPTQPFMPPVDPMQATRWPADWLGAQGSAFAAPPDPAGYFVPPTSPGIGTLGAPPYADLSSGPGPNPDPDAARSRQMYENARRAHEFALWAFGPPSAPRVPAMRQAAAPFDRASQLAAADDPPGPQTAVPGVDDVARPPAPPAPNAPPWPVDARDRSNAAAGPADAPPAPALAGDAQPPALEAAVGNPNIERQGARIRAAAATRPPPPALVQAGADRFAQGLHNTALRAAKAVTDIPNEISAAGADALHNINAGLNPFSAERRADLERSYWESQKGLGRGLLGIPELLGAPITGVARSVLGHALETLPGFTYDAAKQIVDKSLIGLGPGRGGLPRTPRVPIERSLAPPVEPLVRDVDAQSRPALAPNLLQPPTLPLPALPAPPSVLALPQPPKMPALSGPKVLPPQPQFVVRGGLSLPGDLQKNASELIRERLPGRYGISAAMDPNSLMGPEEIAAVSDFPNRQITYTTAPELQALGYRTIPTPYGDKTLHASILLRPGDTMLSEEEASKLSALLGLNRMNNPNFVPRKPK